MWQNALVISHPCLCFLRISCDIDGYIFGCKSIFSYKMRRKFVKERYLSSHLLATVLLKHLVARSSSTVYLAFCMQHLIWIKVSRCHLQCPWLLHLQVNLLSFKDSSSDCPSSSWPVATSCPWLLCLSRPAQLLDGALHLAKLPKCSIKSSHMLLFHSWPSRYRFDLQQNKFAEKAFSCLD